ncbi:Phosphoglucomutase / Phosphomannomutase [Giardia duodenalis]|uniref:Phosphoglucomutase / Phosphomannomutase n=1 Tax=Giardia intestinalis TaxID=5741 RepID=V6TND9_GIAIN|nr:Phosphoglucomutase / Phosphomannomutase [Giardia intestinalis]
MRIHLCISHALPISRLPAHTTPGGRTGIVAPAREEEVSAEHSTLEWPTQFCPLV